MSWSPRTPPAEIDASALRQFFDDKVAGVRAATAGAAAPQFTAAPVGCELRVFTPVTPAEVIQMVRALPGKQYSTDPMPTKLLKENVDLLAPPFLSQLFCWSLQHGVVPTMKSAYITPILKKTDMDWIRLIPSLIGRSQICPCFPSCWRVSSLSSL